MDTNFAKKLIFKEIDANIKALRETRCTMYEKIINSNDRDTVQYGWLYLEQMDKQIGTLTVAINVLKD